MSATGRLRRSNLALADGAFVTREKDDFYRTPAWCTRAIWPHLIAPASVLDPCCGDGAILDVVRERAASASGTYTLGLELDGTRAALASAKGHAVTHGDALRLEWPTASVAAIVTNPPYTHAEAFLERALYFARGRMVVAFLLRLGFLASQKRARFHRENPSDVYVLPRRPSFTGKGTDSADYAWMVWGPGRGGRWSVLDVERSPS